MPRACLLAVALACASCLSASAASQELTEQEVVKRFLAASPHVREARGRVAAISAEARGRTLWPNPSTTYSREGAGLAEFFLFEQPLAISGRLGLLRRANAAAVSAAESDASGTIWELTTSLRQAFRALVHATRREQALRSALGDLDETLRVASERERQGEGSRFDRLRVEREQSEIGTQVSVSQANTAEARSRVTAFLPAGLPSDSAVDTRTPPERPLPPIEDLLARAFEARSDYVAEHHRMEQIDLEARAAERLRIPEPLLSAGVKRGDTGSRTQSGGTVSVTIPLPLFNRGKTELERLRAERERSEARGQALRQAIAAQVRGAYITLELRRKVSADYAATSARMSSELTQIARIAYQEGEVGILEVLDTYRSSHQSELRSLDLKAAIGQAEIELERAVGMPVLTPAVAP